MPPGATTLLSTPRRRPFPRAPTGCSRCRSWATASAPTPICEPPSRGSRSGTAAPSWPGRCWRERRSRSGASWSCSAAPAPPSRSCGSRAATRGWRRGIGSRPTSRGSRSGRSPATPPAPEWPCWPGSVPESIGTWTRRSPAASGPIRRSSPRPVTRSTYDEAYGAYTAAGDLDGRAASRRIRRLTALHPENGVRTCDSSSGSTPASRSSAGPVRPIGHRSSETGWA